MNTLDKLRAAQEKRCVTVEVGGVLLKLAPLTAMAGMALRKQFSGIDGLSADDPRLLDFYVELIALSAIEPDTSAKALDCDEGRALIRNLPVGDMMAIGGAAAEVNDLARTNSPAKKNFRRRKS